MERGSQVGRRLNHAAVDPQPRANEILSVTGRGCVGYPGGGGIRSLARTGNGVAQIDEHARERARHVSLDRLVGAVEQTGLVVDDGQLDGRRAGVDAEVERPACALEGCSLEGDVPVPLLEPREVFFALEQGVEPAEVVFRFVEGRDSREKLRQRLRRGVLAR